jgi:hypothetical protein
MKGLVSIVLASTLWLLGCTTTQTKLSSEVASSPPPGSTIVLVKPDVSLALLTASGVTEPREDWNRIVAGHLSEQVTRKLEGRSHRFTSLDPKAVEGGRAAQLLRLNEVVGKSILLYSYGVVQLPSKRSGFDWTLGEGARDLAPDAQFAMFVHASGTYSSGARIATAVGLSLLGVGIPLGQQQVIATLVDLQTGRIVWSNMAMAGPTADMREEAGAENLTESLLKDIPL